MSFLPNGLQSEIKPEPKPVYDGSDVICNSCHRSWRDIEKERSINSCKTYIKLCEEYENFPPPYDPIADEAMAYMIRRAARSELEEFKSSGVCSMCSSHSN